jgi:hypothetical protein
MPTKQVRVPINSPAWRYYMAQGWVVLRAEGNWALMSAPN